MKTKSEIGYYSYKEYLVDKYHEKTYKLPINIPCTCPNRDGTLGYKGCYFCSEKGTGFESLEHIISVSDQLAHSKANIINRYNAQKFIGYFQNYTTTHLPINTFINYLEEAARMDLVGIDIATRPDCINEEYLDAIHQFSKEKNMDITIELGLQIANDDILKKVNRGHNVACFEDAVKRIKQRDISVCTHLILNLPGTTDEDILKTVNLMNTLDIDIVKLHSLYIAKDSEFEKLYLDQSIVLGTQDEYIHRVILFISYLKPSIAISRLVSRIPEEDALFSNWNQSWWKIYNDIMKELKDKQIHQGYLYEGEVIHE